MFAQQETEKNKNAWLYATVILASLMAGALIIYGFNYFNLISLSDLFTREMKINGEIFIVTQGKENYKLGLVEVCAIPEKQILEWVKLKENQAKTESVKAQKLIDPAQQAKLKAEKDYNEAKAWADKYYNMYMADVGVTYDMYQRVLKEAEDKAEILNKKTSDLNKTQSDYDFWFSPAHYFDGLNNCEKSAKTNSEGKFLITLKGEKYALAAHSERKVFGVTESYYWLIWVSPDIGSNKPLMLSNDNLMEENPQEKVVEIKKP